MSYNSEFAGFYRKDHLRKHTRSHIARRVKAELSQQGGANSGGTLLSLAVPAPAPPPPWPLPPAPISAQTKPIDFLAFVSAAKDAF